MDGSAGPELSADKLLQREGLILSYLESVSGKLELPALKAAIRAAVEGRTTLHPDVQHLLARQIATPKAASPLDALTEREVDVLRLIASGQSNKAIAKTLFLSVGTVKGYVSAVLAKLGVNDRTQAALWAVRHGVVDPAAEDP